MPRRLFKRWMPDPQRLREHRLLRHFGRWLHIPNLWQLNRHSIARAMLVGLFVAFMPMPLQMVLAAALAIVVRANLPISVGLVWLTNPLTVPPIFYLCYRFGAWVLQTPRVSLDGHSISQQLSALWQPLLLGSLLIGGLVSVCGYGLTLLYWRWRVSHQWRRRKARRREG